ncbi:MAG TPA: hypothetical protein VI197_14990 [Polyangiaceae bacterium]
MRFIGVCAALIVVGCAGAPPTVSKQPAPAESEATIATSAPLEAPPEVAAKPTSAPATTRDLPTQCVGDSPCLPPAQFAESLCKGSYPSVALAMFEKSTPWQRKWVNVRSLEAVNAFGGSASGGPLNFGEEVVLLRRQQAGGGGMQMSGGEDVEVLRWNGTCVTVRESELVEYVPGLPKHAPIVWAYLDEPTQTALLTKKSVASARDQQRKECRGSSKRDLSPSCEKAAGALDGAIVVAVRKGMQLPVPEKRPAWEGPEGDPALTVANQP